MDQTTKEKIFSILQNTTGVDPLSLQWEKPIRDQIDLDSMQFMAIVSKLENDLGIELPLSVMEAETMSQFMDELDKELGK